MKITSILQDEKFNVIFSFLLGLGLICIVRPMCEGKECVTWKPPAEKDFDKFVYRLADKCYSFQTKVLPCPATGAIEAFQSEFATRPPALRLP